MELAKTQFETISSHLPIKRDNVKLSDHQVLTAILYVAEQGCKWRAVHRGIPGRMDDKGHMVAADARTALTFSLSPGSAHDAPEGRAPMAKIPEECKGVYLIMDKAYEGDETRQLALDLGFEPVVPHKENSLEPWK